MQDLLFCQAVFSFGFDPESSRSMFQTLPTVFGEMPGGKIFGLIFFVLVLFAAVSTSIAYLEVVVSFAVNTFKVSRAKASVIFSILITCVGIPCALTLGYGVTSKLREKDSLTWQIIWFQCFPANWRYSGMYFHWMGMENR